MYATQHHATSSARPIPASIHKSLIQILKRARSSTSFIVAELDAILGVFPSYASAAHSRIHLDVSEHIRRDAGLMPGGEGIAQVDAMAAIRNEPRSVVAIRSDGNVSSRGRQDAGSD